MNRRNEDFKKERESFLTLCCEAANLAKEKSHCNSAGLDAREVEGVVAAAKICGSQEPSLRQINSLPGLRISYHLQKSGGRSRAAQ
jgi:hypothetical protein